MIMKTIIIDPGHGGADFGATNGNRYEKNDNLRLGLAVRDKLSSQSGVKTIMTRDTDVFIPLTERSNISNRNNADIFVSLHRNYYSDPRANGVENFVMIGAPTKNTQYALNVLGEVVSVGVQGNRGVKQENFAVLRNTIAPAQLLEMGFISNETDNVYFDRYLDSYATAIARGIMKSLGLSYIEAGDRTAAIRGVQTRLNNLYGAGLTVDGIYGPNTRRAIVRGLQTELNNQYGAGLGVDGVFGANTRAAVRSLRSGARGNIVYLLQSALLGAGFDPGMPDGVFGRNTSEALLEFQRARGLVTDGIAGPATFAALLSSV